MIHCVLTMTSLDPIVLVLVELVPLLHSRLSHSKSRAKNVLREQNKQMSGNWRPRAIKFDFICSPSFNNCVRSQSIASKMFWTMVLVRSPWTQNACNRIDWYTQNGRGGREKKMFSEVHARVHTEPSNWTQMEQEKCPKNEIHKRQITAPTTTSR